jgi:hypothetical protein
LLVYEVCDQEIWLAPIRLLDYWADFGLLFTIFVVNFMYLSIFIGLFTPLSWSHTTFKSIQQLLGPYTCSSTHPIYFFSYLKGNICSSQCKEFNGASYNFQKNHDRRDNPSILDSSKHQIQIRVATQRHSYTSPIIPFGS